MQDYSLTTESVVYIDAIAVKTLGQFQIHVNHIKRIGLKELYF